MISTAGVATSRWRRPPRAVAVDSRDGKRRTPPPGRKSCRGQDVGAGWRGCERHGQHGNTALHLAASGDRPLAVGQWRRDRRAERRGVHAVASRSLPLAHGDPGLVGGACRCARPQHQGETALHMAGCRHCRVARGRRRRCDRHPPVRVKACCSKVHQAGLISSCAGAAGEGGQTEDAVQLLDALKEQLEVSNPLWLTASATPFCCRRSGSWRSRLCG